MTSSELAKRIEQSVFNQKTGWWSGRCPAHDDRRPSLTWRDGDKKLLITCLGGCAREQVLAALNFTENDTWLRPRSSGGRTVAATYDYRDEAGELVFQSVRYRLPGGGKTFSLRRPDPGEPGGWVNDIKGVRMVLYNLDKIQRRKRVVIVEGEKDADRLNLTGLVATTNPMGAGKWRDEYSKQLVDAGIAHAVVVPDNDEAGARHAEAVKSSCLEAGLFVSLVTLPDLPPKGDVSDYLDAHSVDELFGVLFTDRERRALYVSKRMDASMGKLLEAAERALDDGDPRDIQATARALRSVDPAVYAPFTLEMLLDAAFGRVAGLDDVVPPERPYPDDLEAPVDRAEVALTRDRYEDKRTMWRALAAANDPPTVFLYGDTLFKMVRDAKVVPMVKDRLHSHLIKVARWVTVADGGPKNANLDPELLKMMLVDDDELSRMPRLDRVVRAPVFAADGRLVQEPGYDAASGVYLAPAEGLSVRRVSAQPSDPEVLAARGVLLEVLADFPFTTEADRAAAVALALLPFARAMVDGPTPLHVISAAAPGTGKSLLLEALTTIALGHGAGAMTEADHEEETRKRITSQLLAEPTFVVFENLNKMIRGSAVAQALTARTWEDRLLGVNKIARLPVRCCWIAVANNPQFTDEVADRVVTCRIVAPVERPRDRDPRGFRHPDLAAWVRDNRGDLVWACLTLVQNWVARGRRKGSAVLGSFQAWAETMSGILEEADVPGLLENRRAMLERADPVGDSDKAFVEAWYAEFGVDPKRPIDLVAAASGAECNVDASKTNKDGSPAKSEQTKIGNILKRLEQRVYTMPDGVSVTVTNLPRSGTIGRQYRLFVTQAPPRDEYLGQ